MKNILLLLALSFMACESNQPVDKHVLIVENESEEIPEAGNYDSIMAARVGADKYGMKKYVMAFLKAGPNREQDSLTAANLQKGHMENIQRMANEGKLIVAGPFLDKGELRGIYIYLMLKLLMKPKSSRKVTPQFRQGGW